MSRLRQVRLAKVKLPERLNPPDSSFDALQAQGHPTSHLCHKKSSFLLVTEQHPYQSYMVKIHIRCIPEVNHLF
jgi:hypothetical protein